jgi:predicted Zn finger-like uncharacterized protein
MMIISCPVCKKKYGMDDNKFKGRSTAVRCAGCGQVFKVSPAAGAKSPPDPAFLRLTCPGCGKQYKINRQLIKPGKSAAQCNVCGHQIPIKLPAAKVPAPDPQAAREPEESFKPQIPDVPASPAGRRAPAPRRKKTLLYTAAAVVLCLALITGTFFGYNFFLRKEGGQPMPRQPRKEKAALSPAAGPAPVFYVDLNLPLIRKATEERIPDEEKDIKFRTVIDFYDSLGLGRARILLFPEPEHQVLPVLILHSRESQSLEQSLMRSGIIKQILEPDGAGLYKVKAAAVQATQANGFPIDLYRVWINEKWALYGPTSLAHLWSDGNQAMFTHEIVRFAETVKKPDSLIELSVYIPKEIPDGWEQNILPDSALQSNPQVAMMAGMSGSFLAALNEPLKKIRYLAVGFKFDGERGRLLSYAQQFRGHINGAGIYEQLQSGNWENPESEAMAMKIAELIDDERLESRLDFQDNRLTINLNWQQEDDQGVFQALTQATLGFLMSQSMSGGQPSEGPVETHYVEAPSLATDVNAAEIKGKIPKIVQRSLFPGHFWDFGDEPRMDLTVDPLDLPNGSMAELSYEILTIGPSGGKNVLRPSNEPVNKLYGSYFSLPVKKGTRAKDLETAKIRFNVSLPVTLQVFEFNAGAAPGIVKKAAGTSVKLKQLEKDVASVSYRGGKSCFLYAYDKTGRALGNLESMGSSSSKYNRFRGIVDRLQVVVVKEVIENSFAVQVDLNHGSERQLPDKPDHTVPVRFADHSPVTYTDITPQELQVLKVRWTDDNSLVLAMPRGPFSGSAEWETHFFHANQALLLPTNQMRMGNNFILSFRQPPQRRPDAVFGKLSLDLDTGIERLTFVKQKDGSSVSNRLPSGQKVAVTFDKNQVTFDAGSSAVLQVTAYDAKDGQLRKGNHASRNGSKRTHSFWGQPAIFVMDVATGKVTQTFDFDIHQNSVNPTAYKAFKDEIALQGEIVAALKSISRTRKKHYSAGGETLAGLYYLHHKQSKPMKLIERAIAHSDPVGKSRYGYQLKPYKGYHFSYLAGTMENGAKKEYNRKSRVKKFTWKKGSFKTKPYRSLPDIIAYPTDRTKPTFILVWDGVYMKYLNGDTIKYIPAKLYSGDWLKSNFVSG